MYLPFTSISYIKYHSGKYPKHIILILPTNRSGSHLRHVMTSTR